MKLGLSYLVLATSLPTCFVSASSSFLSQGRSRTNSQAISLARTRLQAAALELAQLGGKFVLDSRSLPLKPFSEADLAMARDHLGQTVDKLLNNAHAGNRRGQELLRSYVMRAPPSALIWPLNDLSVRASPFPDGFSSFDSDFALQPRSDSSASQASPTYDEVSQTASSMSEETVMRDGKLVKRVTRCRNGHCVQETKVAKDPAKATWLDADEHSRLTRSGLGVDGDRSSIADAAQRMASEMGNLEGLVGSNGLDELLNGLARRGTQEIANHSNDRGHSETLESETNVQNGQLIRRVRRCQDGHCTTQVQKADAAGSTVGPDQEDQQQGRSIQMPL